MRPEQKTKQKDKYKCLHCGEVASLSKIVSGGICSRSGQHDYKRVEAVETNLQKFTDACEIWIHCNMCGTGEKVQFKTSTPILLCTQLIKKGWRYQNDQILCQYCTDDKR